MRPRRSVRHGRWRRWLAAPLLAFVATTALAQTGPLVGGDGGYVCPPVPEALVKYRNAPDVPPPPSAEDLAVYHAYVASLQANDWAYLCRYRDENRDVLHGERPRVVLLGDSITENWKARDPGLFRDGIVDRGIGGQTAPQMLLRFYQDVIALRPRVVHIMAGTNDIAGNTGPTSDTQYRDTIRAMVDLARAHDIKVILASIPPASAFPRRTDLRPAARIRAWNGWLRDYACANRLVFVDYHAVLTDAGGGLRPEFTSDGVHPTRAGYVPMDALFLRALAEAERR